MGLEVGIGEAEIQGELFKMQWGLLLGPHQGGTILNNPPAIQETQVPFLGMEDPQKKEIVTHSSILSWEISRTEEPGGLQSMESQKTQIQLSN